MDKDFSAKTCPSCRAIEITTIEDIIQNKQVYICGKPRCTLIPVCNTVFEVKLKGNTRLNPPY